MSSSVDDDIDEEDELLKESNEEQKKLLEQEKVSLADDDIGEEDLWKESKEEQKKMLELDKAANLKKMLEENPQILTPGREFQVQDFDFVRIICHGQFGKVWHAWELSLDREVAIKELDKETIENDNYLSDQLHHQIFALNSSKHPHIVKLLTYFKNDQRVYLVTEYASCGSLWDLLSQRESKKLRVKEAATFLKHIAQALDYLHRSGYLHGDVRPENIYLDSAKNAKLGGFSLCWPINDAYMRRGHLGTMEYLPPEMLLAEKYDQSIDYWAFGVLMYELLCGNTPFFSPDSDTIRENILNVSYDKNSEILNGDGEYLLENFLVREPHRRLSPASTLDFHWFLRCCKLKKPRAVAGTSTM